MKIRDITNLNESMNQSLYVPLSYPAVIKALTRNEIEDKGNGIVAYRSLKDATKGWTPEVPRAVLQLDHNKVKQHNKVSPHAENQELISGDLINLHSCLIQVLADDRQFERKVYHLWADAFKAGDEPKYLYYSIFVNNPKLKLVFF